jgi:glycosyltransferase involved in cell wall biosynthesis
MQDNRVAHDLGAQVLLNIARRFKPDILHSNQYCFGSLPLDMPKLITAHSDVLSWAAACRPEGLEASAWLDRYRMLVQRGLDSADGIVAPTAWMLQALLQYFEVKCGTEMIPNGRTLPKAPQGNRRALRAVSAGRLWDEAKGLSLLQSIKAPMPIFVAGEEAVETSSTRGQATAIKMLGALSENSLLSLFRSSAIYIATSLYEPFGLAPLEAAMCGCAVVARDLPSFREVWGDAALYYRDASCLIQVLRELATNQSELHQAQTTARLRAIKFSGERMGETYLALYSKLVRKYRTEQELAHDAA